MTYRAFLDKLLPKLDSILSLDADLLVLRDLNYFNNINMQNYFIAGACDIGNPTLNRPECKQAIPNFHINAGVMLFNLKNIRDNNGNKEVLTALNTTACSFDCFEQDLLNIAFADRIHKISIKWNYTPYHEQSTYHSDYITKFILHYYAGPKPWNKHVNQLNDFYKEYLLYSELTPWKN